MGTLTADCPRLDTHCPHKLATSCRLTSTPNCCACADERPHSRLYRVYIDGIGFVQRGTRWQSYCWFCKEFWGNRLATTDPPLEASQTRIPLIPDQTEFLERWEHFHQGFRIVRATDGTESRIAVIGEPLREVSPGFLPRTVAQLRAGRVNDASRFENRTRRRRLTVEEDTPEEAAPASIEDALDHLLAEISDDNRHRDVPAVEQQQDVELPRHESTPLSRPLRQTEMRLQRTRDRLVRVFGSREDVQRDDYESPLSTLYNRAETRYQQAEQRRATGNTSAPSTQDMTARERREVEEQILWGVMNDSTTPTIGDPDESFLDRLMRRREASGASESPDTSMSRPSESISDNSTSALILGRHPDFEAALSRLEDDITRLREDSLVTAPSSVFASTSTSTTITNNLFQRVRQEPSPPTQTLDTPGRPPSLTDAQMTKNLACQVCYVQTADVAVLPCGHMCMCQWCADVVVPVRHSHFPARPSKCPMCRKGVKQRFKIHIGGN